MEEPTAIFSSYTCPPMRLSVLLSCLLFAFTSGAQATAPLHNVYGRAGVRSLNGAWHYLVDPYDTGYRNHRNWAPFDAVENTKASASPYYLNRQRTAPEQRIEYDFAAAPTLQVPGDWNHQHPELLYYEGAVWYQRHFEHGADTEPGGSTRLYFGAANYRADVYLNGRKVGAHEGGYQPFDFDVTDYLRPGQNDLLVRVENHRAADRVPGLTSDWWNYGGLTRDVLLIDLPAVYVADYHLQLDAARPDRLHGYVQLGGAAAGQKVELRLGDEPDRRYTLTTDATGRAAIDLPAEGLQRWYPERPHRYEVSWRVGEDYVRDRIGFRTIDTQGEELLLNGQPLFLRGICLHDENPYKPGRVTVPAESALLLGWAKELNANFVRLAHYPHNEYTVHLADSLGLLLWEEVPVYWGVDYANPAVYAQAEDQLRGLIQRDKNRAATIVWSVANETPKDDPARLTFLNRIAGVVRALDPDRLLSAALDRTEDKASATVTVTDPFAATSDLVSVNEYIGWYGSTPDRIPKMTWDLRDHDKPLFISEFGAGALAGLHGPREERWTEDHQAWLYTETLEMLDDIPSLRAITPWILVDFRSPRRNLTDIQDGWNRKGIIGADGRKKQAFYVLRDYYARRAAAHSIQPD